MNPHVYGGGRQRHGKQFSTSRTSRQQNGEGEPFHRRLRKALRETKIKWYPIPAALGIGFLGLGQLYRVNEREKKARREEEDNEAYLKSVGKANGSEGTDLEGRPYRRKRIRPSGPWYEAQSQWPASTC
jgi:phosphatidylserine decarboxylase